MVLRVQQHVQFVELFAKRVYNRRCTEMYEGECAFLLRISEIKNDGERYLLWLGYVKFQKFSQVLLFLYILSISSIIFTNKCLSAKLETKKKLVKI